jgi:hypothetical protein
MTSRTLVRQLPNGDIVVARLTRSEMLSHLQNVLEPSEDSSEDYVGDQLNCVAWNSPDPLTACDLIIETPEPITAQELLHRILQLPARDPSSWPENELPLDYYFRRMRLESLP